MKDVRKHLNKMMCILKKAMVKSVHYTNNKIDHEEIRLGQARIVLPLIKHCVARHFRKI